jgi:hypothetical protein
MLSKVACSDILRGATQKFGELDYKKSFLP